VTTTPAATARGQTGSPALATMLEAASVGVVGASPRVGSFGREMLLELERGGYEGEIFPINPRYPTIDGRPCHPSLETLGRPVDIVLLGVPNALLESQMAAAAAAGTRGAVIFASCFEEVAPNAPPLTERIAAIARSAGMAICGGNCMGFLNVERGLRACGFPMPQLAPGGVTFITHSGSAFAALAHNDRNLRFNLVVSAGQELVTTSADYLRYALELDTTRVVAMFLETVRDPTNFEETLAIAADRGIPVVVLKVGRQERTKRLVEAHSGALAGSDAAYEALFDAYGVLRVATLDELTDTAELLAAGRKARPGGLASIHDSGGERALLVDAAADAGVEFATLSGPTVERLEGVLEQGLSATNPLDAWGTGNDAEEIFRECMDALLEDPSTAALAFCVDMTTESEGVASYVATALEVYRSTHKPMAMLGNLASAIDRADSSKLRDAGVPVLEGTATGLAAFRHLFAYRDFLARSRPPATAIDVTLSRRWRERLMGGRPLSSTESLTLLSDYGIPVAVSHEATTAEEVVDAAERIGWPVALKTASRAVAHKSDVGGIVLDISGKDALLAAYRDLAARLGPQVLVGAMAPRGVELALGIVRDEQFGPIAMVGTGGVLIEVLKEARFILPPIERSRALEIVEGLRVGTLLHGVRGAPAADIPAVADAVAALSRLADDLGPVLDALDVNPLIAGPDGCLAVDALVVPRTQHVVL
jgi:acetate---CoA ligase (ADP-forming)